MSRVLIPAALLAIPFVLPVPPWTMAVLLPSAFIVWSLWLRWRATARRQ